MKCIPRCEASRKTETEQPFEEGKENPSRLQRYVDESLAFHLLEILYPVIIVSQEKRMWKNKDRIRFCLLPEGTSTCHVHGVLYSTTSGGDLWSAVQDLLHLCDSTVPCWDSKSGSGKATASLAPSQLAWRSLHRYGGEPKGRWDLRDQTGHYLAIMERHLFSAEFNQLLLLQVSPLYCEDQPEKNEDFQIYFEKGFCKGKGNNLVVTSTAKRTQISGRKT